MSFSSLSLISNYGTKNNKKVVVVNLYKILYYNFEGGLATDSFNSYSGTTTGTALTTKFSKFGSYSLESLATSIAQYVSIPTNIPITNDGLSFSLWIYPTNTAVGGDIILFEMNVNNGILLWNGVNTDNYQWCGGTLFVVSKNVWTHLVLTISSTNVTSVYKNGVLVATGTTSGKYPTNLFLAQGKIGRSISSTHKPLTGYIDEFQIYNTILTVSDVATIYSKADLISYESSKLLFYNFEYTNGGSITLAKDNYNSYDGTIGRSGINTTFSYKGSNSLFNGLGSAAYQTNVIPPNFIQVGDEGISISFWLYTLGNNMGSLLLPQRIYHIQTNLHKATPNINCRHLYLVNWFGTTNYSLATTINIGTQSTLLQEVAGNKFSFPNNEWHFITITIAPNDECKLYLDKDLVQTTTFGPSAIIYTAYPISNYPSGYPTTTAYPGIYPDIGFKNDLSSPINTGYCIYKSEIYYATKTDDGRSHHGYLDDFKMFKKLLTSTEIDSLYNNYIT